MAVTETTLQQITERIVTNFDPEKVILFGSQATGVARFDSDVDLLVIMESNQSPMQRAVAIKRLCRPRFVAMDMLVKTPDEVLTQLQQGNSFLQHILRQGRVLYERQS